MLNLRSRFMPDCRLLEILSSRQPWFSWVGCSLGKSHGRGFRNCDYTKLAGFAVFNLYGLLESYGMLEILVAELKLQSGVQG